MHQHRKTPLWVSAVAIFVTIFAMLLFGGASYADEAQSAAQSTTAQSVGATTVAVTDEAQSSSSTAAVADAESSSDSSVATAAADNNESTSSCTTPQDISPGEVSTSLKTSDGSSEVTAFEEVEFSISLNLEPSHCAGDSVTINVPSELGTDGDHNTIAMTTPEGIVIANAEYRADHTVKIVLTNQVEVPGRKDFYATAWWRVHMSDTLVPGETRELRWDIDGVVRRTPIKVGECPGCSTIGKDPSKWGSVDGSAQHVTIVLPTATEDGQRFVVTDTLTSPGQWFACDNLMVGQVGIYTKASTWGQPQYVRFQDPVVTSCASNKAVLEIQLNAGEKARLQLNIGVDPADPGPWTDVASITSQDKSWEVSTKVVRRESGGNAGFDTNPVVPTPTPTPEPTPSPAPTPTPAPSPSPTPTPVTPTPAPSASPSPSPSAPSPSVTPTPTPSASPSPTPSASPSPSTTPEPSPSPSPSATSSTTPAPVPTPTPTPAPTPRQFRLPVTGGAGSGAIASAVALLVIGIGAFWARRRQTAHSED